MKTRTIALVTGALALPVLLLGCQDGQDAMKEKAALEGAAAAEQQVQAENANLTGKAREMETDLAMRHRFYQAVKGSYEGELETGQGTYRIRLTLVPSLPPYKAPRIRQLSEIASDLNNLYFNAQVVQWNPANALSAVGCRISGIRPDLVNGEITIASESCPNLYSLRIAEGLTHPSQASALRLSELSSSLALQITEGKLGRIDNIAGEVHPSTNAAIYRFVVARPQQ